MVFHALAASSSDYAVQVSATVQTSPALITLSWPADPGALYCALYRKSRDGVEWGTEILLSASATNYLDYDVATGGTYEYQVHRITTGCDSYGYVYAGIAAPLAESRGKLILLVDNSVAASLTLELARLQQDLIGDGWTVLRHDVPRMAVDPANTSSSLWATRSNELASAKAFVTADYNADPVNVKALLILGHVPVPYSGDLYPDGHLNHRGAWPADAFYADLDGSWADSSLTSTGSSDLRNRNIPGDGKLDQTQLASDLELQVGRVDFANLPAFLEGEIELLRRYLNKDHGFRHRQFTAASRGLIDDELGLSTGEAFSANGWRDFAAFFGVTNTVAGDWQPTLSSQNYLWGFGCGGGTYTSCSGVATTSELATSDPRVVFTMFFGSYFGDWDSQNNLLRAAIATTNYTLTSAWVGRPFWFFHHMGLGETIGFSTRVTQNDDGTLYSGSGHRRFTHIALMGDPTLRMHIVSPPAALSAVTNGAGGVNVSWSASTDSVLGYHVYRAATAAGPFTRINSNLVTSTSYSVPEITTNVYMVRAVKLEVSGSGSYYNASQGILQSLDASAGSALVLLRQPTNNAVFLAPTNIALMATTFDPANCITNVAFFANGVAVAQAAGLSQSAVWSNAPAGSYLLVARASCSNGLIANSTPANVVVAGEPPMLTMFAAGGGVQGSGVGSPIRAYRIEFVNTLADTNWQTLHTVTSSPAGLFQFTDTGSSTQKFYRSVSP